MIELMARRPHWLLVMGGVFLLGVGWILGTADPQQAADAGRLASPHEGFVAPDIDLETLTGERLRLVDLRGKVVVVNLWTSWCPPCRQEMPALQALSEDYRDAGLVVLGVNLTAQDSQAAARAFASENGLTFPILFDSNGDVSRAYALQALPSTYIVGRNGVIREVLIGGPVNPAVLRDLVAPLLKEGA